MFASDSILKASPLESYSSGTLLLQRAVSTDFVFHIESGRVGLGLAGQREPGVLEHQLGGAEGPSWLDATAAVLNLPSAVDAVAETDITVRRIPLNNFRESLDSCSQGVRDMLQDLALAHRQQTDLAVSRLAKDAEARCAEWLLRHAQSNDKGASLVQLQQRKRLIAAQLGIAPETLSRVFRHLRERRLISGSGRIVNLVDPSGLRSLAGV
jgi:CRP-like cAMP-binding protein